MEIPSRTTSIRRGSFGGRKRISEKDLQLQTQELQRVRDEEQRQATIQSELSAKQEQDRQATIQAGTISGQLGSSTQSGDFQDAQKRFRTTGQIQELGQPPSFSEEAIRGFGGGQPSMISEVTTPGGVFLGDPAKKPFRVKIKESIEATKDFIGSFQAQGIDPFISRDTEFLPIIDTLVPDIKRSVDVQGSLLFTGGGGGTIIEDFQGFGSIGGGLTLGEFKLETQRQRGELPEFVNVIDPSSGKIEREVRLGGSLGVPRESVEALIFERAGTKLQQDITSGSIIIPGEGEDFQKGAQDIFSSRTGKDLFKFDIQRGERDFTGFGKLPITSLVEIGGLVALSTTPTGSIIAGGLLIGRGSKNIQEALGFEDLTFGQRAGGVGLGVLDIGFGLGIGGRGATQTVKGLLSKSAIKEAQRDLGKLDFKFDPGKVIGKGGDFKLIEQAGTKQLSSGLDKQTIKTFSLVTETRGGGVSIPGGRAEVKTQIFDPITDKLIRSTKEFTFGTKFPLDVSTGGKFIPKGKGVKAILKVDVPELTSVEGTGFIKPKGGTGFTEFDVLATGGKLDNRITGFATFDKGVTRVGVEEVLFKETGKDIFRPSGKVKLDFKTTGARISRTEKIFSQTGEFSPGIGEQIFTKEGLPIIKFGRKGVRVSEPSSVGLIFESKNVPRLDDLFDIGIQPVKKGVRRRGKVKLDFGGTGDDIIQLKTDFKAPPISGGRPGGTQLINIPSTKVDTFTETSLISAGGVTKEAGKQISVDLIDTSFRPLAGIPGVGRGRTVKISKEKSPVLDFSPVSDIKAVQDFGFGKGRKTGSRAGLDFGTTTKSALAQASIQDFQRPQKRISKKAFQDPFGLPTITPGGFSEFRDIGKFGGFAFAGIPSLGSFGAPPKRRRKEKKVKRKIRPSFTASVFELEGVLPKGTKLLGISPFDIRFASPGTFRKTTKKKSTKRKSRRAKKK